MKNLITALLVLFMTSSFAQVSGVTTVKLWSGTIPNSKTSNSKEEVSQTDYNVQWVTHVQEPTMDVYLPTKRIATGMGILICPGGGYSGLAYDWEGTDIAKYLNARGIAAFVLKYRLPGDASVNISDITPLQDAQRAMRLIRSNLKNYHLEEGKIGVMGFSAGGHLASTLGTKYSDKVYTAVDNADTLSARPDFMGLIYPVISMKEGITHQGSKDQLLGKKPSEQLVTKYSGELQVTKETPVTFLLHANDDGAVPVANSLLFYEALRKNDVAVEMHIFPKGGHGFSMGLNDSSLKLWLTLFEAWLQGL